MSALQKRAMRKKIFKNKKKYQETKTANYEQLHDLYLLLVRGH